MAAKMFAEVVIAGSYRNLAKSTKGAKDELKGFEKATKKMSGTVKAMLGGIGLLGFGMITDTLKDMTKSAAADAKSIAILNKQMDNSWKATDKTKTEMNAYLDTVSNMTGILDDDLRPAFGKIVRTVKGPTKAMAAFNTVMDISAGTGKDVNTVAQAYSKYLAGNKTSLEKLVPGLKNATDQAGFLKTQFAGMAETAGANDPFARINAVMDNFKEKVGTALLPFANKFADWLAGPDAQAAMDSVAQWATDVFSFFTSPEGQAAIKDWYDKIAALVKKVAEIVDKLFQFQDYVDKTPSTQGIVPAMEKLVPNEKQRGNAMWNAGIWGGSNMTAGFGGQGLFGALLNPDVAKVGAAKMQNVTINVTATSANGADVVKALKSTAQSRGVTLGKLLQ